MTGLVVSSQSAIFHLLVHKPGRISRITFHLPVNKLGPRLSELYELARTQKIAVDFSSKPTRDREAVTATLLPFQYTDLRVFLESVRQAKHSVVLALDHLQDPQNFGALCRTAEGLGASGVITPKDRGVHVSPGVYNASVGAVETLPVVLVSNLGDALRKLKENGFWIVGTDLGEGTKPLDETPSFDKVVLVLGAELEGLSPTISKLCDWLVTIPLPGRVQSLNVSAAGAILLYSFLKNSSSLPNKEITAR